MTRDEFIDGYIERSGITPERTPDGFILAGQEHKAMKCDCGDEACEGWAMCSGNQIAEWEWRYNGGPYPFETVAP